ncbi:DUF551 domain-containing protein [Acinetobacter sp. YH12103]|uniref:DUF551 domain-containing protein n=1 Tax=Acinetobacter sp. YH12103 TaxID=2601092 RepID=UPI0015D15DFB|nr:DUF551 domain-containing protein [Acinetobacter sp. YH12103]
MDIKNTIISAEVVIESLITLLKNEGVDISSIQFSIGSKEKGTESDDMSFESLIHLTLSWLNEAKAQAVPEWISVEDSLPKKNANVLLNVVARRRGKPFSCIGFYSVEPDDEPCFILDDNFTILKGVTHWMPLPDAPQEPAND